MIQNNDYFKNIVNKKEKPIIYKNVFLNHINLTKKKKYFKNRPTMVYRKITYSPYLQSY